jgi:hypothetical protein
MPDDGDRLEAEALFESTADEAPAGEPPTELQAMFTVGETLRALPDADARARVLQWALKAFNATSLADAPPQSVAQPPCGRAADDDLELGDLTHLFDENGAAAPSISSDDDALVLPPAPSGTPAAAAVSSPAAPSQSVESMIRGFVAEFQAFAREWGATGA